LVLAALDRQEIDLARRELHYLQDCPLFDRIQ